MQLRLVEGPTRVRKPAAASGAPAEGRTANTRTSKTQPSKRPSSKRPSSKRQGGTLEGRPLKGAVKGAPGKGSRRAVHWADWHLDARTRRVGRAGVAAAKAALEQAARPEPGTPLSKAS